jgi:hypothetical protein
MILFVNKNSGILFLKNTLITVIYKEVLRFKSIISKQIILLSKLWKN